MDEMQKGKAETLIGKRLAIKALQYSQSASSMLAYNLLMGKMTAIGQYAAHMDTGISKTPFSVAGIDLQEEGDLFLDQASKKSRRFV